MCLSPTPAVRLYRSGRYFYCPFCHASHEHPPFDRDYYCIGYGFCQLYMSWLPLEGGDEAGVVETDERGRRTVLWAHSC
ncbi:MAG TPA: hypothetical protein VF546_20620 [Pyrinomonadaceae bacterium]|jgi:hypothetical protein